MSKDNTHLEIKKMRQGMSYSCKEKTIILNVFKYFRLEFPERCVTDIVRRTARATGCSEKSIFQFRKEEASEEGFREPSKTKIRRNININSREIKYDRSVRNAIRGIIYDLINRNIVPSLATILKNVNANKTIPNFSLMTLRRLMADMGFGYEKNGNKCVLVERPDPRYLNWPPENPSSPGSNEEKPFEPKVLLNEIHNMSQNVQLPPPPPIVPSQMPIVQQQMQPQPPVSDPNLMPHMHNMHQPEPPPPPPFMGPPRSEMMPPPPNMMLPRRDMIPHSVSMDLHYKRDSIAPWMHGLIKQQ